MGIFKKIKNLFKKGGNKQMNNGYYNQNTLLELYNEYQVSEQFLKALEGDKYYNGKNDINKRLRYRAEQVIAGKYDKPDVVTQVPDDTQPNSQLSHNFAKALVDQKVNYSMSKAPQFNSENDTYLKYIEQILEDNNFDYSLNLLGKKASCNGVSWLHTYIENGQLKFMVIPSFQIIPLWKDDLKQDVSAVIRVYATINQDNPLKGEMTVLEYWNESGMQKFTIEGNTISPWLDKQDLDALTQINGAYDGQNEQEVAFNWGRVPFIPFKNNYEMATDIQYIKNLIDGYDIASSDMANTLQQIADAILVISNAQGQSPAVVQQNINLYKLLLGQTVESGIDAKYISPELNPEAINTHLQRLKENIIELSQSVNFDINWTQPPSGVTLNILYRNLDIKCNGFEAEFKRAFNMLQDLIKAYANAYSNNTFTAQDKVKITFVRDVVSNTAEQINNLKNSSGQISKKTIMEKHPLVDDPEEEYKQFNNELDEDAKRENFSGLDDVL